jgi:hypothetical protein
VSEPFNPSVQLSYDFGEAQADLAAPQGGCTGCAFGC